MTIIVFMLYLTACVLCGLIGRRTAFGFIGHFILALIVTPVGDLLIQLVGRPSREIRRRVQEMDENLD